MCGSHCFLNATPTVCGGIIIWLKKDGFDEEIIMITFGERIKSLRKAYGLTQNDVDTFLRNRSRTALTYWESGQVVPGAKNLTSLADFFGVTTYWLLGRSIYIAYTEDSVVLAEYSAWRRLEEYMIVHQEFATLALYQLYISKYIDIRREYSLASRANIAVLLQLYTAYTNKKEILHLRKITWLEQFEKIFMTNEPVYVLEEID